MKLGVLITVFLFFTCLCGCVEEPGDSTNDDTNGVSEHLTDVDWNYYVFSYTSGKDLHELFDRGFTIINTELTWFDPTNSSFLLEITPSNKDNFTQLEQISTTMNENISRYALLLNTFSVSPTFINHSVKQQQLFVNYQNLSNIFRSINYKIRTSIDRSNTSTLLVDISEDMVAIFTIDESRNDIMNDQVDMMIHIPDDIWDEWTKDRDWSFMD